ncbi:hypothetical protein HaLaN_03632 [Haematococcus lacustris]|uniref:Uncharacterized protein n=1 Tax=Haematococcus lacustris TaxID=44745 RepID=A0A699YZY5_HAELA|nr:hypothetical protein HaLaN_03632 [Haematococcus lacustris]
MPTPYAMLPQASRLPSLDALAKRVGLWGKAPQPVLVWLPRWVGLQSPPCQPCLGLRHSPAQHRSPLDCLAFTSIANLENGQRLRAPLPARCRVGCVVQSPVAGCCCHLAQVGVAVSVAAAWLAESLGAQLVLDKAPDVHDCVSIFRVQAGTTGLETLAVCYSMPTIPLGPLLLHAYYSMPTIVTP